MEFTAENLEKAVTLFYRTEALQQAEAHQWLTEAQNSPQAWGFVWELLNPLRVCTLPTKPCNFYATLFTELGSTVLCSDNATHETNEILERSTRRPL